MIARLLSIRALFFLLMCGVLSSCATLKSTQLRFNDNRSGVLTLTAEIPDDGLPDRAIPEGLVEAVRNCQFDGRLIRTKDGQILDASMKFDDSFMMSQNIGCLPTEWTRKEFDFSKQSGFLFDTWTATVWLEVPIAILGQGQLTPFMRQSQVATPEWRINPTIFLPQKLTVVMPADISLVEVEASIRQTKVGHSYQGNVATILLEAKSEGDEKTKEKADTIAFRALRAGEQVGVPVDSYKVKIVGQRIKYGLESISPIAALVGMLFGSGIVAQLIGYLRLRATRRRKSAGTGDALP